MPERTRPRSGVRTSLEFDGTRWLAVLTLFVGSFGVGLAAGTGIAGQPISGQWGLSAVIAGVGVGFFELAETKQDGDD